MRGFNRVILSGNLTRDPETRFTPSGTAICKFGLAINRSWKDANGNQKEDVTFLDIDAFGKQAEAIGQYLRKGKPILLEGRLKLDVWDDKKTNEKRSKLGVVLESFTFLGDGKQSDDAPPRVKPAAHPEDGAKQEPEEDDVPF